jgi:alkylation response protein AidB-like acyl-CoA dehydrogenase
VDYRDSPEVTEFRKELRAWIADYRHTHDIDFSPSDFESVRRWNRDLAAAGYVATSFPVQYGGRGLAPIFDAIVNLELASAGAPPPPPIAHYAHSIADFGSEEMKQRLLPGMLNCTEPWCQGFSEPSAGSDLASLKTSGVIEGDTIRVNGQKIWTSGAMWATWCLLLARTEPGEPRHRGLSMVVVDLSSPGIDRRPITLSTGSAEFAEVFFDGVEVPVSNLVGARGQGWAVAMHMLSFERGPADMGWTGRYRRALEGARARLAERVRAGEAEASQVERLVRAGINLQVLEWQVQRTLATRPPNSGAEGSIDKLLATRVEQELYRVLADLRGADLVISPSEDFNAYLYSRAQSIYGGSQQIQRNLVAQRILGLPRP